MSPVRVLGYEYKQPTKLATLDMHRWLAGLSQSSDVPKAVSFFYHTYGDFFGSVDFEDPTNNIDTFEPWRKEWESLSKAAELLQAGTEHDWPDVLEGAAGLVEEGLSLHTSPSVVQHQRRGLSQREGSKRRIDVAIRPNSWAGFSWALLARDLYDGITYRQCESSVLVKTDTGVALSACGREIPNKTLTGARIERFCSEKCRRTVNKYEAAAKLREVSEEATSKLAESLRFSMQPFMEHLGSEMQQALQAASKAMNSQISPIHKEIQPNIEKAIKRLQGDDNEKS